MSAVFQPPPAGTVVAPAPGGILGKPPNGFVYPNWLPQIPGTVVPVPKVVEPPHECPTENFPRKHLYTYTGLTYDACISNTHLSGQSLRDCEVKNCSLDGCTLTDCLVINCVVNGGSLTDVELRSVQCYQTKIHDVKATGDCRFGHCTITEADATGARFFECDVSSSEVSMSSAWASEFRDATLRRIFSFQGSTFADCGGDVPKNAAPAEPVAPTPAAPYEGPLPTSPDCPTAAPLRPSHMASYSGKGSNETIVGKAINGKTLVDCEVRDCWIVKSTLTDCLVVGGTVSGGRMKDVELRGVALFKADIDDVKAIDKCKFGECTVNEGDLQNSHFDQCVITSSEVTNGIAWDTKFRDAQINKVKAVGKCRFALCGGDVPKRPDSSSDDDDAGLPSSAVPSGLFGVQQPPRVRASAPPAYSQQSGAYSLAGEASL